MKSPQDYVKELNLDEDQVEDIEEEIGTVDEAWGSVVGIDKISLESIEIFENLFSKIGTTYSAETHGEELKKFLIDDLITKESFIDWYLRWIFENEGGDEDDVDVEREVDIAPSGSSSIKWTVAPTAAPVEGVTWKCPVCRIINKWENNKCLACESWAPHVDEETKKSSKTAATPKEFETSSTSSAVNFSNGFVFGSSGFSFGSSSSSSTTTTTTTGSAEASSKSSFSASGSTGVFNFGIKTE